MASQRAVARALGVSRGAVRHAERRALRRLRGEPVTVHRCSSCRELGHTRRSCSGRQSLDELAARAAALIRDAQAQLSGAWRALGTEAAA